MLFKGEVDFSDSATERTVKVIDGEKEKTLNPRASQRVANHSPDGFNWGYGGSGPAQLALAILLEVTNKDVALRFYQDFKWAYIAPLDDGYGWQLSFSEVYRWLAEALNEKTTL